MIKSRQFPSKINVSSSQMRKLQTKKPLTSRKNSVSQKQNIQKEVQKIFVLSKQYPCITLPVSQLQKQINIQLIQDGRQNPLKMKLNAVTIEVQKQHIKHSFPLSFGKSDTIKILISDYSSMQFRIIITVNKGKIKKSVIKIAHGNFCELNPFKLIQEADQLRKNKIQSFKMIRPCPRKSLKLKIDKKSDSSIDSAADRTFRKKVSLRNQPSECSIKSLSDIKNVLKSKIQAMTSIVTSRRGSKVGM